LVEETNINKIQPKFTTGTVVRYEGANYRISRPAIRRDQTFVYGLCDVENLDEKHSEVEEIKISFAG
jgi:hypothetical protein